jgi:hypothetical protein
MRLYGLTGMIMEEKRNAEQAEGECAGSSVKQLEVEEKGP